jgi:hypothetical protein
MGQMGFAKLTEYIASIAKCWYNKVICTETVMLRERS